MTPPLHVILQAETVPRENVAVVAYFQSRTKELESSGYAVPVDTKVVEAVVDSKACESLIALERLIRLPGYELVTFDRMTDLDDESPF